MLEFQLLEACKHGQVHIVKKLLEERASIEAKDQNGCIILITAAFLGLEAVV